MGTVRSRNFNAVLEDTNTPLPHLEAKWLASLRQFLSTVGGTIEVDDPQVPTKERAHDWHIMDAILQSGQFSDQEIRQLNYCRLYLQAVTLSDITNARGTCLDLFMLQGRRHTAMSLTKWHLVNQQRPPARAWTLWRRANGLWSHPDGTLKQPLGAWQFPPQHLRRHWPAYYSEATETVYYRQSTSTIRYVGYSARQCQRQAQRIFLNSYDQMCASLPDDAIPVDTYDDEFGRHCVMVCSSAIKIARKLQNLNRQHNRPVIDTFHSFLMSLDPWESDLLRQVQFKYDVYTTVTMLSTGFIAASDGSVVHQRQGAYGWIVATPRGDRVIWAAGPARGRRITSYRAEGYGILSVLRLITRLFEYCQQTGTVEWHVTCDNSSMVDQIATIPQPQLDNQTKCEVYDWTHWQEVTRGEVDERDPALIASISTTANPTLEADWDLINEIRWNLKEQQHLQGCTVKHIKGHQDQSKTYSDLSLDAQLNVDADRLAREYQDTMDTPEAVVYLFPHASAQLHLRDGTATSQMSRALRSALTEQELTKYIQTRLGWSDRVMQSVDWEAHHLAIKRHNKKRIQITKLIYELVPTNKVVYRNQPGQQHCHRCNSQIVEDRDHIVQCAHPECATWRAKAIAELAQTCAKLQTDPILTQILSIGFRNWTQNAPFYWDNTRPLPPKYWTLIQQQQEIGWRQLLSGRMTKEWSRLQADYDHIQKLRRLDGVHALPGCGGAAASSIMLPRTGTQWTSVIITEIWRLWEEAWTQRNASVHGLDRESRAYHLREKDTLRLRTIYQHRTDYEPSVQELLYDTVEEHLHTSTSNAIHNWLQVHETTFIQSLKKVKKRALRGMRSIYSYFATGRPPGDNPTNYTQPRQEKNPSPEHT
jgi:hypothetical protein